MKYLLDTCLVSELVRKKPNPKVVKWVSECDEELTFLSVLTLGEIQKGIAKLGDRKRKSALQMWLDSDLRIRFETRILPVTEDVAQTWGVLQGEAETKGIGIPTVDGLLGATAITHNLTVVTRNTIDIAKTGAKILDPWNS
ncbi:MAG TPA: type II toxin-antitoxin system VapC family toxin [Fibrobacteria bacterium]|nr:type II toxin-antitoxin system VapC family toxin [Fibrobacteria bacterium]